MASPDGLILTAGALALAGNFKESGGFPENGYAIISGTVALAFILSFTNGTPLQSPSRAFAALTLLVAVYQYVPTLYKQGKRKNNG